MKTNKYDNNLTSPEPVPEAAAKSINVPLFLLSGREKQKHTKHKQAHQSLLYKYWVLQSYRLHKPLPRLISCCQSCELFSDKLGELHIAIELRFRALITLLECTGVPRICCLCAASAEGRHAKREQTNSASSYAPHRKQLPACTYTHALIDSTSERATRTKII